MGRRKARTGPSDLRPDPASDCLKGGIQDNDDAVIDEHSSAASRPSDSLYDVSVISACPVAPPTPAPHLLRRSKHNRSRRNCHDVHRGETRKERLRFFGLLLILQADPCWSHVTAYANDCRPDQYHDPYRLVCRDRCGSDNELICPVELTCSSNQRWSRRYDPPFCVNRCTQTCDKTSYCDHDIAECRLCKTLCDGIDMAACRAYCYDVYITLPAPSTSPPWETCNTNQYYDFDRKVCLDRCGADNEERCGVDQFCSASGDWGVKTRPPACVNHCPHPCDDATYCDIISHQCHSCGDLCGATNIDLCRIHCFGVFMNVTSLEPQTTNDPAPITSANNPVLSADIITSVRIYPIIVGVLSATIVFLIGVLAIQHYRKSQLQSRDDSHDIENSETTRTLIQTRTCLTHGNNHACEERRDV